MISRLHYITQEVAEYSHVDLAMELCRHSKVDWIQLRMKDKSASERLEIGLQVREICNLLHAKLIINDYVALAEQINADGVHLGQNDMPVNEARAILGNERIIGGTANTFEDIKALSKAGVNYIGLGPFRFTPTKKNLSDVLGINGYNNIMEQCQVEKIDLPIIAIGGIELEDIPHLMHTGIHGIAVASAINTAVAPAKAATKLIEAIDLSIAVRN